MLSTKKARRRALSLALLAGFVSTPAFAGERFGLEDTVVTDATGNPIGGVQLVADEAEAPVESAQPVVDPVPMPEPIQIDEPAPMPEYAAPAPSCSCCTTACCTKAKKEAATAKMKSAYAGVFYANDFSYLNDPCYDGPAFIGDSLKGMLNGKLDVGGEARVRFHHENNHRGLGLTGNDDNFFLTRYRMFANLRVNEFFRVYGEYLYADSGGETFSNRPIEENRGEIQNLFLDTRLTEDLSVRIGRQEMLLGDQRLISPLDWANTRRTFQGVRGTYKGCDWTVDGFFLNPVNRVAATESKIDDANEDIDFYGVYLSNPNTRWGAVDYYYLGLSNQALNYDYHTIGSRWSGKVGKNWLYSYEGGTQFGTNSPGFGDHSASFFTGGLGRQLELCTACGPWKPTFWAWYDYASGGNDFPGARGDDSFDHMFPLAHKYLGLMDLFGRRNIHDLNFQFITPILGSKVNLLLWYHNFWLDELTTPYGVTLAPYNSTAPAADSELGQELDIAFTATINPRMNVLVGYSHFNAGAYYHDTAGVASRADADFFYTQWQWRF